MIIRHIHGDILEIGCGLSEFIRTLPPNQVYVGVDSNKPLVEMLKAQFPTREFFCADVETETLALADRRFDTLLLVAVCEHFASPEKVLSKLNPYLKQGGRVVLTTPTSLGHLGHRWGARLGIFSREAAEDHQSIIDRRALDDLFARAGLALEVYRRFQFGMNQFAVGVKIDRDSLE